MSIKLATLVLSTFSLLAIACSPASVPATGTAPAASSPFAATSVAPTATRPSSPPPPTATTLGSATPAATPAGARNGHLITYKIVADGTEARYRVREQLADRTLPSDAVGRTNAVTGQVVLDPSGKILSDQSKVSVDLTSLRSDSSRRDAFIQRNPLQTSAYPTAEFVPTEAQGLPTPLPEAGQLTFKVLGSMTMHGVTKPLTWDVTARVSGTEVTGQATTTFKFEDFGMTPPRAAVVLSVQDDVKLEVDFHLKADSAAA